MRLCYADSRRKDLEWGVGPLVMVLLRDREEFNFFLFILLFNLN